MPEVNFDRNVMVQISWSPWFQGLQALRPIWFKNVNKGRLMNCDNKSANMSGCNCSYEPCPRKGICCQCIAHHRAAGQLPACYFSAEAERTYDRSIAAFIRDQG